jgi:S-formylglutathione hydrolase FrmB
MTEEPIMYDRVGNIVWWLGMSDDRDDRNWTNVFRGVIDESRDQHHPISLISRSFNSLMILR